MSVGISLLGGRSRWRAGRKPPDSLGRGSESGLSTQQVAGKLPEPQASLFYMGFSSFCTGTDADPGVSGECHI